MNLSHMAWLAMRANRDDIRELAGDVAEMGKLHFQLFAYEARLERDRLKRKLLLCIIGSITALTALFFTLGGVIMAMWDTPYRLPVIISVPVFLWLTVSITVYSLNKKAGKSPPFAKTIDELKKDSAWLMSFL